MNQIDEIEPSEDTRMTDELIRIFKSAGCSPTACHACEKEIKSGDIFKLVPHPRLSLGYLCEGFADEMCCGKCGTNELTVRDNRLVEEFRIHKAAKIRGGGHGFSRPSKVNK